MHTPVILIIVDMWMKRFIFEGVLWVIAFIMFYYVTKVVYNKNFENEVSYLFCKTNSLKIML